MRLSNSCKHNQLDFFDGTPTGMMANGANASAPADGSCDVFGSSGGSLTKESVDTDWLNPDQSGNPNFGQWVISNPGGTIAMEIVNVGTNGGVETLFSVNWLKQGVCEAINDVLKLNLSAPPPQDDGNIYGDDAADYAGKWEMCRTVDYLGTPLYQFSAVLIAR